jgi:hypothetical protein
MSRRRWRALGQQLNRLVAELICLAPIVLVPHASNVPEAITGEGLDQPLGGPHASVSITDARSVVVAGVRG